MNYAALLGINKKLMKTVFILEDQVSIQEVLELLLTSENYNVVSFSNIRAFNSRDLTLLPDLFLLDVMLPDGLGTEVCLQLKSDPLTSHVPVLLMSAHAKIVEMEEQSKADDFISKPFDIGEIISKVGKLTAQQN